MEPTDLPIQILQGIRDEIRQTNARLDNMNVRLDGVAESLGARIDETNTRLDALERRSVESEMRLATELTAISGTMREVATLLRTQHDLRPRVERCETDIADLKQRIGGP